MIWHRFLSVERFSEALKREEEEEEEKTTMKGEV